MRGQFTEALTLVSNHFHLLVQCDDPAELSPCMAGLLRAYVHYHHRRYGFVGHLWQGRFKSPAVAVEEYFLSCARYIERNPVEANQCANGAPNPSRNSCARARLSSHLPGAVLAAQMTGQPPLMLEKKALELNEEGVRQ